jgi:predicted nucleic acid-binding protein
MSSLSVVDTSVLMAFAVVERLDLLGACFSKIIVPGAVALEAGGIVLSDKSRTLWSVCESREELYMVELDAMGLRLAGVFRSEGRRINGGESEVLAYAKQHGCLALTDDLAARVLAASEEIAIAGTLGVLSLCKRKGLIPRCGDLVERMAAENRHFGRGLIQMFLKQEREV